MGWNVLVTREIPEAGLELLRKRCETVEVNTEKRTWPKTELIKHLPGHDAVICLLTDTIDAEVLNAAKEAGIKIFANMAVGYNNIDVAHAAELGIFITNTPGVLTETTAELTWALIFGVSRHIVQADAFMRRKKFCGWEPMLFLGRDLKGKTLGIIGAGRIGSTVAMMSKGFTMKVIYTDTRKRPRIERAVRAKKRDLDALLQEADIITIHTPLTPETHHLIGEREFGMMKPGAILINAARGPIVDEDALVQALRAGRIFGAGLDVYEREPEVHPGLRKLQNVVLLPHIGSASLETRSKMSLKAAKNVLAVLAGKKPINPVKVKTRKT